MQLKGRRGTLWDATVAFHFYGKADQNTVEEIQGKIPHDFSTNDAFGVAKPKNSARPHFLGRVLTDSEADALILVWNEPEGGNDWMCYEPNHGFATVTDGKIDWCAFICFQCENAGLVGRLSAFSDASPPQLSLPARRDGGLEQTLIELLPERTIPSTLV